MEPFDRTEPEQALSANVKDFTVDESYAKLPARNAEAHKGDFGRVLIIAGSVGYTGAPALAARAAVRMGSGLVFLGVPYAIYSIEAVKNDEAMPFPLPDDANGIVSDKAIPFILDKLKGMDACLIGPGLGRSAGAEAVVEAVVKACRVPLVVDADGINALAGHIHVLDMASCPVILTPHEGEFARLGGDVKDGGRIAAAARFAREHRCVVALKGHRTATAFPDGRVFLNTTGGPGLAKGGSGDVLAGMAVSLLGQKLPPDRAVPAAVYLHGRAGDLCTERFGEYCMTPSDVIDAIPDAMR